MIPQVILAKLFAAGAICTVGAGVGYVAYEIRTGNGQGDALIMNAGMFAASHVTSYSNIESEPGYGGQEGGGESDSVSLMGSTGAYKYSRMGKAYE